MINLINSLNKNKECTIFIVFLLSILIISINKFEATQGSEKTHCKKKSANKSLLFLEKSFLPNHEKKP